MPYRRSKTNSDWRKGPASDNAHARIKYMNACIKSITSTLPKQSFTQARPLYYESQESTEAEPASPPKRSRRSRRRKKKQEDKLETPQSREVKYIKKHFYTDFPLHPYFSVCCAFCPNVIPPQSTIPHIFEQPHSRRRFTPMCHECKLLNERTDPIKKGF
jgi:hypothetical protein